jgi:hypothetical protein
MNHEEMKDKSDKKAQQKKITIKYDLYKMDHINGINYDINIFYL